MRVIAGALKGRRLVTPRGATTRPTADQVRTALMDTLAPRLPGARMLDLFAGAGAVGLEALSRGAAHATFVERDGRAAAALVQNVRELGVGGRARVLRGDVGRELTRLAGLGERFEIVFLDPRTPRTASSRRWRRWAPVTSWCPAGSSSPSTSPNENRAKNTAPCEPFGSGVSGRRP